MSDASPIRLTIPARPEYITLCRLALTGLSRVRAFSDETLADLKLALTEACSNAVRHAYADGEGGVVDITYDLQPDRVVIEVADNGTGFDPASRGGGEDELREGGLGIAIIRSIADEFEIGERGGGAGLRLRFAKKLGAEPEGPRLQSAVAGD